MLKPTYCKVSFKVSRMKPSFFSRWIWKQVSKYEVWIWILKVKPPDEVTVNKAHHSAEVNHKQFQTNRGSLISLTGITAMHDLLSRSLLILLHLCQDESLGFLPQYYDVWQFIIELNVDQNWFKIIFLAFPKLMKLGILKLGLDVLFMDSY